MKPFPVLAVSLVIVGAATLAAAGDTDAGAAGKKIFLDNKCNACHAIKSQAIAADDSLGKGEEEDKDAKDDKTPKPPDLSNTGNLRTAEFLHGWLRKKETIDGRKHQRRFSGSTDERETLVNWLVTLKDDKAAPKAAKTK